MVEEDPVFGISFAIFGANIVFAVLSFLSILSVLLFMSIDSSYLTTG